MKKEWKKDKEKLEKELIDVVVREDGLPVQDRKQPYIIRDFRSDRSYGFLMNPRTEKIDWGHGINPIRLANFRSFFIAYGGFGQAAQKEAELFYDPTQLPGLVNGIGSTIWRINKHHLPARVANMPRFNPNPCSLNDVAPIADDCPNSWQVLLHAVGGDEEGAARFLNWVAYTLQTGKKTMTAWVLSGVEGTGKGLVQSKLIRPLFGKHNVAYKRIQNLEDRYNEWARECRILVIDEFSVKNAWMGMTDQLSDILKDMITEERIPIRAMYTNQKEEDNWLNLLILTNYGDSVRMTTWDRRYNVAERQSLPLQAAHPDIANNIHAGIIEQEFPSFAHHMTTFEYGQHEATRVLLNKARQKQITGTDGSVGHFASMVLKQKIEHFVSVLDEHPSTMPGNALISAQRIVVAMLLDMGISKATVVTSEELRCLYHVISRPETEIPSKLFRDHIKSKLEIKRQYYSRLEKTLTGVKIKWRHATMQRSQNLRLLYRKHIEILGDDLILKGE